jgi:hypothetical protein
MSTDDPDLLVLNGRRFWSQSRWSKDRKVNARTVARHRALGLPWLAWAGVIYIPEVEGDEYIAARIKRRPNRRRGSSTVASA